MNTTRAASIPTAIAAALALTACVSVNYVGQSFPPTDSVEVLVDPSEIRGEYEIIGRAIATGGTGDEAQTALVEEARARGADIVVIDLMGFVPTGATESATYNPSYDRRGLVTEHRSIYYDETLRVHATMIRRR